MCVCAVPVADIWSAKQIIERKKVPPPHAYLSKFHSKKKKRQNQLIEFRGNGEISPLFYVHSFPCIFRLFIMNFRPRVSVEHVCMRVLYSRF